MPFTKGESGNPEGRPKGSENNMKKELREKITRFLLLNFEEIFEEIEKLKPKEKVKCYLQLLPYGLAKVKQEPDINFERLTEEEMDEIIEKLMEAQKKRSELPHLLVEPIHKTTEG